MCILPWTTMSFCYEWLRQSWQLLTDPLTASHRLFCLLSALIGAKPQINWWKLPSIVCPATLVYGGSVILTDCPQNISSKLHVVTCVFLPSSSWSSLVNYRVSFATAFSMVSVYKKDRPALWITKRSRLPRYFQFPYVVAHSSAVLGLYSLRRRRLISIGIPIINLRWSSDRLRFIMGIPIPVRRRFLCEQRPWWFHKQITIMLPTQQTNYVINMSVLHWNVVST